jgi:hypothetical protein
MKFSGRTVDAMVKRPAPSTMASKELFTLVRDPNDSLKENYDSVSVTASLNPADKDDRIKLYVPVFTNGSAEAWLEWKAIVARVVHMKSLESTPDLLWQTVREFVDGATATEWDIVKARYEQTETECAKNANPPETAQSITTVASYKTLMEELDKKHVPTKLAWSTRNGFRT